jgi:hypothetical protein
MLFTTVATNLLLIRLQAGEAGTVASTPCAERRTGWWTSRRPAERATSPTISG